MLATSDHYEGYCAERSVGLKSIQDKVIENVMFLNITRLRPDIGHSQAGKTMLS